MTAPFDMIAFDADDTLWHNETIFLTSQTKFKQLLGQYHSPEWIEKKFYETEGRNLQHFGYGVKGFTLSMIETAIELSEGRVTANEIQSIIEWGKVMLQSPIELLDGVRETVLTLANSYRLIIITKGDLFDQESKIARSGLGDFFSRVEIVSEKEPERYRNILQRHGIEPARFLMIGNSIKSDILPVVAIGGRAVHVPYASTWIHDMVTIDEAQRATFITIDNIRQLPELLKQW